MKRKFAMSLAPLLAIATLAVMPVAAQAVGHYYSNGVKLPEGSRKTVIEWGRLTLNGVKGGTLPNHVTCHYAAGGTIENPVGAGAGVGATEAFAAYDCEQENICPTPFAIKVTAEKPAIVNNTVEIEWPSELTEPVAGKWRSEMSKVKLDLGCYFPAEMRGAGEHFVEIGGYETEAPGLLWKPETHNGTSAAHPGGVVFTPESGELQGEVATTTTFRIEGELKILGFTSQELINVKP